MTQAIHIRLPDDQRNAIEALATQDRRNLLDMIRKLLWEALEARQVIATPKPQPPQAPTRAVYEQAPQVETNFRKPKGRKP